MSKWTLKQVGDQTGKTVIVTGANSGLGFATASALAGAGAHVVLACRSAERGKSAVSRLLQKHPKASVELMSLDLGDLASVRTFAAAVTAKFSALHVLVNNAGIMFPPFTKTLDGFESQFGVNHLGHFALTAQLVELLAKTPGSRVVNVSSLAHKMGGLDLDDVNFERRSYGKLQSYGQSKLANLLFTFEMQRRIAAAELDIEVMAVHPGWTNTNLQDDTAWIRVFNPLFAMPPEQGSLPSVYAAVAPEARGGAYYGPDGWFELRGYPDEAATTKAARDLDSARRLWELSELLTGVPFDLSATRRKVHPGAQRARAPN